MAIWQITAVGVAMAWLLALSAWAAQPAAGGEVLYNGIVLPQEWPPKPAALPRDPVEPFYLTSPPEVIPIDVGRQLFVDDFLIEDTTLSRQMHLGEYYPGNPVHQPMPYSGGLWFDPADQTTKLWYGNIQLAASRDGVHFDHPTYDVKPGTNFVMSKGTHSSSIWMDADANDPARKFVMIYTITFEPSGKCRYWIRFSGDGIHWGEKIATNADCGDRSTAFYNPFRNKWVYSIRQGWGFPRARRYWEVTDLVRDAYWNKDPNQGPVHDAPLWVGADSADKPWGQIPIVSCELYNHDAVPYESLMLGYFCIWHGEPQYRDKPNELCLGFSRDGWSWSRPDRRPFFGMSEDPAAWNWLNIQTVTGGCTVVGDKLYIYVSGRGQAENGVGLVTIRRDGFASMDAGKLEGTLTTRKLTFKGSRLFVNVDDPQGELRVEVLDENGKSINGLTRDRSTVLAVDKTLAEVTWKGGKDLSSLAGKPVRFRFHLQNGRLYSFWVSPDGAGASNGFIAAGGPGFTSSRDTVGIKAYEAVNPPPAAGAAPAPAFWPLQGEFSGSVAVTAKVPLHLAQNDAAVRYTTDGSEPGETSPLFEAPLELKRDTVVKARTFATGCKPSAVATAKYTIKADTAGPVLFNGKPNHVIKAWLQGEKLNNMATEVRLSVTSAEPAECRYAAKAGVPFDEMAGKLETRDGLVHEASLRDVKTGAYTYYIKARDRLGNITPGDYEIRFGVADISQTAPPVSIEFLAINGELVAPMAVVEDEGATDGKCVSSSEKEKGSVSFTFTAPATADYIIYARARGPNGTADSFFVSVDGGGEDIFDVGDDPTDSRRTSKKGKWNWDTIGGRDNRFPLTLDPRIFPLAKGEHALTIRCRDAGALLDKVIIVQRP